LSPAALGDLQKTSLKWSIYGSEIRIDAREIAKAHGDTTEVREIDSISSAAIELLAFTRKLHSAKR